MPDGIGIYQSAPGRLEVFTNHELSYRYGDPAWSRVSHLTLDADGAVVSASYAVDGTERYEYFCSSTMDMIDGVPWYFTGEEWFASPRGGMSIAINALTGTVVKTPQFGSLNHENVVPLHGMERAVDVPVRGLVPPAVAGVRVLRRRLPGRDPRRRRLRGVGARRPG